jgi:hypothetical protein
MKKKLTGLALSLIGCLLFVPAAMADSACATKTMDFYDGTTGPSAAPCNIGGILDFSNFKYTATPFGGGPATPDTNVSVVPVSDSNGIGFNFLGNWSSNTTSDVSISFDVTALGGALIDDIFIDFGNVGGGGTVNYNETFCDKAGKCDFSIEHPTTASHKEILLEDTALKGPVTFLHINKDVELTGGERAATMSSFGNQYSYIPEPRDVSMLLGLGLVVGVLVKRQLQSAQG